MNKFLFNYFCEFYIFTVIKIQFIKINLELKKINN